MTFVAKQDRRPPQHRLSRVSRAMVRAGVPILLFLLPLLLVAGKPALALPIGSRPLPVAATAAPSRLEASATSRVADRLASFADASWPDDARLRSAGLMRAQGRLAGPGHPPEVEVALLREHFAAVDAWLRARTDASLELAVDRLAAARGLTPSARERERLRGALGAARKRQLAVLQGYAARGRFPQNPDIGGPSTPIFVDAYDTACAVGFLMRADGRTRDVERIAHRDNLVYVEDASSGVLGDWALTSGLTIEEAAVIQPAYTPPWGYSLAALTAPGGSLANDGLRIDNFSVGVYADYFAGTLPQDWAPYEQVCFEHPNVSPCSDRVSIPGLAADLSGGKVAISRYRIGADVGGYPVYTDLSHVMFWQFPGAIPNASVIPEPYWPAFARTEVRFDVSAVDPAQGIDSIILRFTKDYYFWYGLYDIGPDLWVTALATDGEEVLGATLLNETGELAFEPRNRITVVVAGHLGDTAMWSHFEHHVNVVPLPEPDFVALQIAALLVLTMIARHRDRRRTLS